MAAALWCLVVLVAIAWGPSVAGRDVGLGASPLVGRWAWRTGPAFVAGSVLAAAIVLGGPVVSRRVSWRWLPLLAAATGVGLAVALAMVDGWERLTAPLTSRYEYEPFAAGIDSASSFVRGFVDAVPSMPTHVKSHPPLATLVPWTLDRLGLGGAGWFAALVIGSWGLAVGATLVAARAVLGEGAARRAAPTLVLLPAVLWAATSADAMFAGVGALGIALATARPGNRRCAFIGGVTLGFAMLLSYGAVLLLVIPGAVAIARRSARDLVATAVGVAVVIAAAAAVGFWWLAGLRAARTAYWAGVAGRRPIGYLAVVGNPGALALATGPAVAAGLSRARNPLALGALAAVVAADLSLLSAGEVERIWLQFVPWLALAAPGTDRRWLAAQAVSVLVLCAALRSSW